MNNRITPPRPINPEGDQRMVEAAKAVEAILPGHAIIVLVAPFGGAPGRRMNYISNGERADIRKALQELLQRWDEADRRMSR